MNLDEESGAAGATLVTIALPARRRSATDPLSLFLIVVFAAGVLPPLIFLLQASLFETNKDGSFGAFTLRYFEQLIGSRFFLQNFVNSLVYSLGATAVAILLGTFQAWVAERTDTPLRQYIYVASIISLGVPYVLFVIAWLLLLGPNGPINELYRALTGAAAPLVKVNSLGGMILIEGMLWAPLAFLLLSGVFRNSDSSFEEAALMSGARMTRVVGRVTLPLSLPGLAALALLIFARALESFEVPALVGTPGGVHVLTTDIYDSVYIRIPADYGSAASFGVVLLIAVVLLLAGYNKFSRDAHKYRTVSGKSFRPRIIKLGSWRYAVLAAVVFLIFVLLFLPLMTIMWASLLPFYQGFSLKAVSSMTTANFAEIFKSTSFRDAIGNTLIIGGSASTVIVAAGALGGWVVARRRSGARILDFLGSSPLAFPSIVLGLAFLNVFLEMPGGLYGTPTSIVLAMSVAFLPYGLRYGQVAVIQLHPELEEAAGIAGARRAKVFRAVVMPLMAPALLSCWLFVFMLVVRAAAMPLLLVGPDSPIVAVVLFSMWANGQITELAALGVTWTAIMTTLSTALYVTGRHYGLPWG